MFGGDDPNLRWLFLGAAAAVVMLIVTAWQLLTGFRVLGGW